METQPPKDPSASVPVDMSAMLRAIEKLIAAAAEVAEAIKGHPAESRENPLTTYQDGSIISSETEVNTKRELPVTLNALQLPESLTAIPGVEIIEVNAPQIYAKFYCHVCYSRMDRAYPPGDSQHVSAPQEMPVVRNDCLDQPRTSPGQERPALEKRCCNEPISEPDENQTSWIG